MNTALYIDGGRVQVVLTAEGKFDEQILARIQNHKGKIEVARGAFYGCQGGWNRHEIKYERFPLTRFDEKKDDDSLFLVLDEPAPAVPAEPVADPLKDTVRRLLSCPSYGGMSTSVSIPEGERAVIVPETLYGTLQALLAP